MRSQRRLKERQAWLKDYVSHFPSTFGELEKRFRNEFKGSEKSRTLLRDLADLKERKEINYNQKSGVYFGYLKKPVTDRQLEFARDHSNDLIYDCLPLGDSEEGIKLSRHYSSEEISLYVLQAISLGTGKTRYLREHLRSGYGIGDLEHLREIYKLHYDKCGLTYHVLLSLLLGLHDSRAIEKKLEKCMGADYDFLYDSLPNVVSNLSDIVMRTRYGIPVDGICQICVEFFDTARH